MGNVSSICGKSHRGRYRFFLNRKKRIGYLGCSWCGKGIGPRRHGAALWNLWRNGFKEAVNTMRSQALLLPSEATPPKIHGRKKPASSGGEGR